MLHCIALVVFAGIYAVGTIQIQKSNFSIKKKMICGSIIGFLTFFIIFLESGYIFFEEYQPLKSVLMALPWIFVSAYTMKNSNK